MALTKQDLENICGVVQETVKIELTPLNVRVERIENDIRGLREQMQLYII